MRVALSRIAAHFGLFIQNQKSAIPSADATGQRSGDAGELWRRSGFERICLQEFALSSIAFVDDFWIWDILGVDHAAHAKKNLISEWLDRWIKTLNMPILTVLVKLYS